MKNILLLANTGIGDHISSTIPLARELSKQHSVHCLANNIQGHKILQHLPCFKSCIFDERLSLDDPSEIATIFSSFDAVYIPLMSLYERLFNFSNPSLLKNVIHRGPVISYYRPVFILRLFNLPETPDINLDINLFQSFYKDFRCNKRSVLVNGQSLWPKRTYTAIDAVCRLLSHKGYEVHVIDTKLDIRTNLHLINQVQHVLTTDTSVFWMAKALEKDTHVFLANVYKPGENEEEILNVSNLVPNGYQSVNDIPPEVIVHNFINRINVSLL